MIPIGEVGALGRGIIDGWMGDTRVKGGRIGIAEDGLRDGEYTREKQQPNQYSILVGIYSSPA